MASAKKTSPTDSTPAAPEQSVGSGFESDTLVEEISIDGMCGVY